MQATHDQDRVCDRADVDHSPGSPGGEEALSEAASQQDVGRLSTSKEQPSKQALLEEIAEEIRKVPDLDTKHLIYSNNVKTLIRMVEEGCICALQTVCQVLWPLVKKSSTPCPEFLQNLDEAVKGLFSFLKIVCSFLSFSGSELRLGNLILKNYNLRLETIMHQKDLVRVIFNDLKAGRMVLIPFVRSVAKLSELICSLFALAKKNELTYPSGAHRQNDQKRIERYKEHLLKETLNSERPRENGKILTQWMSAEQFRSFSRNSVRLVISIRFRRALKN